MKNSINFYEQKKVKAIIPLKKTNYINSIIYKEISKQRPEPTKSRHNRDSKDLTRDSKEINKHKQREQDKSTIPSKKSSLNQLTKKNSKIDLSSIQFYNVYHKLTDNFLDTQEDTRFELEDTKQLAYQKKRELEQSSKKGKYIKTSIDIRVQKSLFNYLYIIGKGGFGKVWKAEHKKTKNQYAMKEMLKSIVMTKKSVQSVMNERVLLSQFTSPFVVNMHFAFQDRDTLYLVLDLMEGGDLRYHIGSRVFNQIQAKFFIACIILGLQDLQKNNIIHRDIKPQNLVLDSRGYIRITDLGIARILKPNNSCDTSGTPGYMSPEVICRMNHSFVSDYFAVGVIAYELMTGKRPYNGRSRNQIRDLMLAKNVQLKDNEIPDSWSYQAADFINRLIRRKPEQRLGFAGISELKNHPWLHGLNWDKLRSKDIQSPFIPIMKKSNFDQDEQITIEDQEEAELIEKNALLLRKPEFQQLFNGYYYCRGETTLQDRERQKPQKRVISACRKSSNNEVKILDLHPEKKMSGSFNQKKSLQIQLKSDKYHRNVDISEIGFRDKKKSGQYQRTFFR